jgi:hypothetical protein
MRRIRLAVIASLAIGCGSSAPASTSPTPVVSTAPSAPSTTASGPTLPAITGAVTGTPLFCAYGGVGIVPNPLPPGYDTQFAAIVVEVDNATGAPVHDVSIARAALIGASGAELAGMRHVDHVVVLDRIEPTGPTMGTFAVYLNPEGRPFDGTLPPGRTILRARVALDRDPTEFADHCRLELGGGASVAVDLRNDGVWPTS